MGWTVRFFFLTMNHAHLKPVRMPTAIVDKQDRVMTILAGRLTDQGWNNIHARMSTLLEEAGCKIQPTCKEQRGNFVSLSTGIFYGGGQVVGHA